MVENQELTNSVISYGLGTSVSLGAMLVTISSVAQAAAIVLGCMVVAVRLIHDSIRLARYIRGEK